MNRLASKVAVVTGASLGIGRACAERLAQQGAAVTLFDVLDEAGSELADRLTTEGHLAAYWHVDVSDEIQVRDALQSVAARFGALHVLVNNAGISGVAKPTHEVTEQEWDRVQAVNVKGVFFCTKHAIPLLRRAGGGSIVNLSSIAGLVGTAGVAPYHASKGAVRLMTKNDAVSYAADRIRVNSVHPGYIWTPMVEQHLRTTSVDFESARREAAALHPLGCMGEPDDVAWAVVYLASDEARFVTGIELVVDGGYVAR